MGLTKSLPAGKSLAATFAANPGGLSVALTKRTVARKSLAATFTASAGSLSLALTARAARVLDIGATFTGRSAALSIALTKQSPARKQLAATFTGTAGTLSLALTSPPRQPIGATFTGTAGSISSFALGKREVATRPLPADTDPFFPVIDLAARRDLILPQYVGAPILRALIDNLIGIATTEISDPLEAMGRGLNPNVSEGVLLDWIGLRLALPRPSVATSDAEFFGFDGTESAGGRTFGQAPFRSVRRGIEDVEAGRG